MRVLAFCDHLSATSSGGAERVAAEVHARLARDAGMDVTVLAVLRPGHEPAAVPGVRVLPVEGRDLSRMVGAELLVARGLGRTARELYRRLRPDVLHANGLHFHGSAVAAQLARSTGTPLVTTAHLGDLSALSPRLRAGATVWDATVGSYIVRSSRAVVAVSQAVATHVMRLGADHERLHVALNGIDHDVYSAAGRSPVGSHEELRAVFVGRLIANKGPAIALHAVADARSSGRDIRLSMLGDGPLRPSLQALAADLGLAESVTFHGHVHDVAAHLRHADVLLRPSFTEGLPLAVLEGMACGLPVICSTVDGNTEVVRHGGNGWHTRPGSATDVAEALVALCDDRERLRRLATGAVAVAAQHSWERSAKVHTTALHAVRDRIFSP